MFMSCLCLYLKFLKKPRLQALICIHLNKLNPGFKSKQKPSQVPRSGCYSTGAGGGDNIFFIVLRKHRTNVAQNTGTDQYDSNWRLLFSRISTCTALKEVLITQHILTLLRTLVLYDSVNMLSCFVLPSHCNCRLVFFGGYTVEVRNSIVSSR